MTANRCSIAGCEKDALARGWCPKHYQRWRAHGDPLGGGRQYKDPAEAFEARTRPDGECLIWTAAKTKNGYGQLVVPGGRSLRSEEHTSELQSRFDLVCRLLLEKKKK